MGWCDAFQWDMDIAVKVQHEECGQQVQTFLREGYILPEPFPVASWETAFVLQTCAFSTLFRCSAGCENVVLRKWMCIVLDWNNISPTLRSTGAKRECPVEITPDRMVVQYQSRGQTATCTATSTGSMNKDGEIYWQVQQGIKTNGTSWFVDAQKDWDARPVCTATFKGIGTCQKHLSFTLYSMYCCLLFYFSCRQL